MPIVLGRDFNANDNREVKNGPQTDDWTSTTVMINEKFARRYFAGQNPIGRHLGFGTDPGTHTDMEIIGVVKDIKYDTAHDPSTLVLAAAGLALVACTAGYFPALRASRLDPMVALRYE